jgi:hypothetical protein
MAAERTPHLWLYGLVRTEIVLGVLAETASAGALFIAWRQGDLGRVVPILIAAALGYLSVAAQVRFHDYGFESCLPFFAMVWGYLSIKTYQRFEAMARACAGRGWRTARGLVWLVLLNIAAWIVSAQAIVVAAKYQALAAWWRVPEASYASYPWARPISHFPDQMRVISYLKENLQPVDGVFVWGSEPLIYFLTERPCPTRFALNLPLISPWSPPAWREEVVKALADVPPRFVVVARDDDIPYIAFHNLDSEEYLAVFPELAALLTNLYEPVADLQFFVIYRRKSLSGSPG